MNTRKAIIIIGSYSRQHLSDDAELLDDALWPNGGLLRQSLDLPDAREYEIPVGEKGHGLSYRGNPRTW